MPKQFGVFDDGRHPIDSASKPGFVRRLNDYAIQHPLPGGVTQGLILGAFITVLGLLKGLPAEAELEPILIIGASTALLASLGMVPLNMRRRSRIRSAIQAASLGRGENDPSHP